mmetsp:Transcript_47554/g.111209  ORF Transcript_47554/g.111209 Transcript_47554/m.111209 type:complete len:112 (+) Transcript_47554:66-401(+)
MAAMGVRSCLLALSLCLASQAADDSRKPTPSEAQEFQQDFLDFDVNKDEQIDAQEVRAQFKGELDAKELHQFFIDVDQDLSGTISLQEYINYASALQGGDELQKAAAAVTS